MTSASSALIASITGSALSAAFSAWSARSAWAARPSTVTRAHSTPTWATSAAWLNGSGISAASVRGPRARQAAAPLPVHSSSITVSIRMSPRRPASRRTRTAPSMATTPAFMSAAPRPYIRPSTISAPHGSCVQWCSGVTGTTSMCPLNVSDRPPPLPGSTAVTFGRPRVVDQRRREARPAERDVPDVGLQAHRPQLVGDDLLRRPLVAERARRAHECAQQFDLVLPSRLDGTAQVHAATVAHSGA